LGLPYRIPPEALIKLQDKETGYNLDSLLVDRSRLASEPLWEKKSTLIHGNSIPIESYRHKLSMELLVDPFLQKPL
jgi:hypothetical protein